MLVELLTADKVSFVFVPVVGISVKTELLNIELTIKAAITTNTDITKAVVIALVKSFSFVSFMLYLLTSLS